MNISQSISYIYPTLSFGIDFEVVDNGSGPMLTWMTTEYTEPTQAELDTAWIEVENEINIKKIKSEKKEAIDKIASLSDQLNMIADVLDTLTSLSPDPAIITNAKIKFAEIKDILNK